MLEYKKDGWKAAIALLPTALLMAVFTFWPIIRALVTAFMRGYSTNMSFIDFFNNLGGRTELSFSMFKVVLEDPVFIKALVNTLEMALISVPLSIVIALIIAAALNSIGKIKGFLQTVFFLPYVTNTIALGLVFAFIFSSNYGLINTIIEKLGGESVAWINQINTIGGTVAPIQPTRASIMTVIMVYTIWNGLAFKIIVFLSGMQSIDKQYYQAAAVDGTPKIRVFWKITVPLLSPMILYITITSVIGAFKSYTGVVSLLGPDMGNEEFITMVGYIYKYVPSHNRTDFLSKASAASIVLFLIIMFVTLIQFRVSKRRVHY